MQVLALADVGGYDGLVRTALCRHYTFSLRPARLHADISFMLVHTLRRAP